MKIYALAGNPNVGKTALFNILTDSRHQVGNWAGVTVEKKTGVLNTDNIQKRMRRRCHCNNCKNYNTCNNENMEITQNIDIGIKLNTELTKVIDLPGIYSLSPFSADEKVTTLFFTRKKVDKLINIVDASNLERNLYFTIQLLEMGIPTIMALNMIDVADSIGLALDVNKMQKSLGIPIVPMSVRNEEGISEFLDILEKPLDSIDFHIEYNSNIEKAISKVEEMIKSIPVFKSKNTRWIALQLLEGNIDFENVLIEAGFWESYRRIVKSLRDFLDLSIVDTLRKERYLWIEQFIKNTSKKNDEEKKSLTEKIDNIILNRWLSIPVFLLFIYLTFQITFSWVGAPLQDLLSNLISGPISDYTIRFLSFVGASEFLINLVVDGIIAGVGGVLVFVPQIFVLFFLISLLEDSGYMARAAFLMDNAMSRIGLNGKAFIPLVVGFGCNVPGIMSARTMEQPRERLVTILMNPFMSCSARLTIYALFVSVFFESHKGLVVFSLYLLGIVMAVVLSLIFKKFLSNDEESFFVIELPAYRIPLAKNLLLNTWDKGKDFLKKAGTIIFGMSVVLWLLSNYSLSGMVPITESFLANIGKVIAPIFSPMGFGSWEASVSLLSGFVAKEVVVSTMTIVYGAGGIAGDLATTIQSTFNSVSAYAFMVFVLLYTPCMATLAVMKRETNSWKWPTFSFIYSLVIAWVLSVIVYQVGSLLFL